MLETLLEDKSSLTEIPCYLNLDFLIKFGTQFLSDLRKLYEKYDLQLITSSPKFSRSNCASEATV